MLTQVEKYLTYYFGELYQGEHLWFFSQDFFPLPGQIIPSLFSTENPFSLNRKTAIRQWRKVSSFFFSGMWATVLISINLIITLDNKRKLILISLGQWSDSVKAMMNTGPRTSWTPQLCSHILFLSGCLFQFSSLAWT